VSAADRVEIDGKADVIGDEDELDHSAMLKKIRRVAHGEDVGASEDREIFVDAVTFSGADEDNRAKFCPADVGEMRDVNGQITDFEVDGENIERGVHRIVAERANVEGRTRRRRRCQANEFAEIEQICRFHVILARL